jgi:hypothetical protein
MISGVGFASAKISGFAAHRLHHLGLQHARGRQAQEDVGAGHDVGQRARVGRLRVAALLSSISLGAAFVDHAQMSDPRCSPRQAQRTSRSRQASAAAPAPEHTSFTSSMFLPTTFRPFRRPRRR